MSFEQWVRARAYAEDPGSFKFVVANDDGDFFVANSDWSVSGEGNTLDAAAQAYDAAHRRKYPHIPLEPVQDEHPLQIDDNFPHTAHVMLHRLWTKAVGTEGYSKKEWQAFEEMLKGGTP